MRHPALIDTNVLAAGLITQNPGSPTARILDGMLRAAFPFLLSPALLAEYRAVLLRPKTRAHHEMSEGETDTLLEEIVLGSLFRTPDRAAARAPDPGDQHLYDLLACAPGALLVTGDRRLLGHPERRVRSVTPEEWLGILGSTDG